MRIRVMVKSDRGAWTWNDVPTIRAAFLMVEAYVFAITGIKVTVTVENSTGMFLNARWEITKAS